MRSIVCLLLFCSCVCWASPADAQQQAIAFGWGDQDQIGSGDTGYVRFPVLVSGGTNTIAVSAGAYHSLALKSDGTVWAWGDNQYGVVGDGTKTHRLTPVQTLGLTDVIAVAAGATHSVALRSDGTVWAWGDNGNGQLGDGSMGGEKTLPVQVKNLANVVAVAAGWGHSLALRSDGTVAAWGHDGQGQLGNGKFVASTGKLEEVQNLPSNVVAIAAGVGQSLALTSDGQVWAWGENLHGELGDGTLVRRALPAPVHNLSGVVSIAACWQHSLAVRLDGTVWAWGANSYGQLGDNTTTSKSLPVQTVGIANAATVGGGFGHSIALLQDGTVCAWGLNKHGQLGTGAARSSLVPVRSLVATARVLSGGLYHNLLIVEGSSVPVTLVPVAASTSIGAKPALKATMTLQGTATPVPAQAVSFRVDASLVGTGVTNSNGLAQVNYTVPETASVGTHVLQADFSGNVAFGITTGATLITVKKGTTKLTAAHVAGAAGATVNLQAVLTNSANAPISGRAIVFLVNGVSVGTATSDASGTASLAYVIPGGASSGTEWPIKVTFAGDASYLGKAATSTLTVQ